MTKKRTKERKKRASATRPRETSLAHSLSRSLERHIWWVFLGLVLVGGLCSYLAFNPNLSVNGDNALYIVLGMSWIQGKGNCTICTPGEPPNVMVPPGYPLLLAPFLTLFPNSYLPLKLLSTVLFLLSLPLLLLIIRDRARNLFLALSVAVLSAINLNLLDFGHMVMTEIPFLFFSLLGILALQRSLKSEGPGMIRRRQALFGFSILALVFSYHIRSIGVVLLVALIAFLILRKRYRLALVAGLVILCLVLPWALRNQAVSEGGGYLDSFVMKNPYNPDLGKITAGDMLLRMQNNLKTYGILVILQALFPSLSPYASHKGFSGVLPILGVLATLLTLVGFVIKVRRSITFIELYIFFFLGVCVLWPEMWSGVRFVIPMVPFLTYYFLVGLQGVAANLGTKLTPLMGKSLIWLVAMLMITSSFSGLATASERLQLYPPRWQNYFLVAQWCREHTPKESVFVARKPSLFYLFAQRQVLIYPFTADTEEMIAFMVRNQVDYVIVDNLSRTTDRYLLPAVQKYIDKFRLIYGLDNPRTWVLKTVGLSPEKEEGG
ncbi:hypothetical protein KAU04_00590 [bacterium]|nr:hypothetical protein [bacterium]